MPSDIKEAERMLDLFTSVGARSFVVTKTDVEQKLIWGKTYSALELRDKLPAMVRTAAARKPHKLPSGEVMAGENLIVRPTGHVVFVQLDDLNPGQLDRIRPASFLIHATSPGNYQAWIAASDIAKTESKEFIRRVRKAVGDADKSASGATRMAGTENWKEKNLPLPPMVSIVYGVPGRVMTPDQLEQLGLIALPEAAKACTPIRVSSSRSWPDYERCVQGAPLNHAGTAVDVSRADYFWCLMSAQRNHSIEIATRLMDLSTKAKENGEAYARLTAENAAAAVNANQRRGRA